jgi:hypothetical protein
MPQPGATPARENLPEHLRWLCDKCRYVIPAGKAFAAITVHRCIRRDNDAVPMEQVSDPCYYCEECAESLDLQIEARALAQ